MDNSGLIKIKQLHKKDCRNAFYKQSSAFDSHFFIQTKLVSIEYRGHHGKWFRGSDQGEGNWFEVDERNLTLNKNDTKFIASKPDHLWIRGHFNYYYDKFEPGNLQSIRIFRDDKPVCGDFPKNVKKTFQSVLDSYD